MKSLVWLTAVLVLAHAPLGVQSVEFKIGTHNFTVPEGFTVEKVAGPGLIDRPIVADFDERGRLYVAESSGSNDPVNKQLVDKPHRIVRLEDTDGDGTFDKSLVFADKMMFPEGTMWLGGSLYVSAPPIIWKLTDTDDDGVADKREEWLDAKTLTGCANDLHGPYLGLDGWIYWCKGAFAKQTYERTGAVAFETRAAHIFRRRPEGGIVEAVMTGGMDNPVDVAFTPEGERIFTTTFFQHPGGGQRDGLVHAIYGGVYGKVHDVIDGHKRTGELMPILTHLGPAAPSGLTRYESEIFGNGYRDNLFAALFNLRKVTRHVLKPIGATYATQDSDFLVSDNTDFHPTDVIEDADGSLLMIDTGGWYKLCCPTSQLWKPDVLGAIYRIRRTAAPRVADARGATIDWKKNAADALADLLADQRPAVVRRAIQQLRQNDSSAGALEKILLGRETERQKINAVWALASNRDKNAPVSLRVALDDRQPDSVRHAAIHALSVAPEKSRASFPGNLLSDRSPQIRRAAAEALGRTRDERAVPEFFRGLTRLGMGTNGLPDRVEEHSIIYALIEINSPIATRAGLESSNSFARRIALIALDQMPDSTLKASEVIPLLTSSDTVLKQTAHWIIAHRKDWGPDLATHFEQQIEGKTLSANERTERVWQLAKLVSTAPVQELVAKIVSDPKRDEALLRSLLELMRDAALNEMPASWIIAAGNVLADERPGLVEPTVAAVSAFQFKQVPNQLKAQLAAVAGTSTQKIPTRLQALSTISSGSGLSPDLFDFIRSQLNAHATPSDRRLATTILGKAALSEEQLITLCADVRTASPLELAPLLAAYEKNAPARVGEELLTALKEARAFSNLAPDQLREVFAKYPEAIRARAGELAVSLNMDATQQSARLEELLPKLQNGDIRRGQAIFNSAKAACSSCHAIGYLGGDLGPDLTKIGQVRTERDLLEAIIYPSASFVRSYESMIVATRDGEAFTGVLRKDATDEVILGTGPGAQVRLARTDITETRPGKVSVMPQGLDEQLSTQELADLLSFLKATRW